MNRVILFRGKRLADGKWIYGYYFEQDMADGMRSYIRTLQADRFGTDFAVDPATVGQYTGLQDMNSNKVFEGDIIKYYKPIDLSRELMLPSEWAIEEIIDEVVFDDGHFCLKEDKEFLLAYLTEEYRVENPRPITEEYSLINPDEYPFLHYTNDLYYGEVIGNIYDMKGGEE